MTIDSVALARDNLAALHGALAGAKDRRELRLIRQNIAQVEAWLEAHGVEVAS